MAIGTVIRKLWSSLFLCAAILCFHFVYSSHAVDDTIRAADTLRESQTIVSASGIFELGFFADSFAGHHFLGIWLKADPKKKVVWIANRDNPVDSSGILQIRSDGNLILLDRRQTPFMVNAGSVATNGNTSATLLDTGNLVLKQGYIDHQTVVWQSFDDPTDTFLPGMKIGWFGLNTNQTPRVRVLVSWVSPQSPSRGTFTLGVDNSSATSLSFWRGDSAHMDIGIWDQNGRQLRFIFKNSSTGSSSYKFSYVSNDNETYFAFSRSNETQDDNSGFTWFVVAYTGQLDEYILSNGVISSESHAICEEDDTQERCLTSIPSKCVDGDDFSQINGSLPTSMFVSESMNMGFSDCEMMCRSNCSCTAFASLQDDQTGCQLLYGKAEDLLRIMEKGFGTIYVRGSVSRNADGQRKTRLVLIILGSLASALIVAAVSLLYYLRKRNYYPKENESTIEEDVSGNSAVGLIQMGNNTNLAHIHEAKLGKQKDLELPFLSFPAIASATDNFADINKLGEGGFGPVYKGTLKHGQEIAVKRLSKLSRQGLEEFKNEVTLIAKLQHRNLVRLLGCCIEAEESILVYEYMSNKSLDSFIFDSTKRTALDWRKRVNIIEGIAQGLLYLHKFSRLRIIHRDLKTSNILLDGDMNPRISDFGIARIFGENETRAKTNRVVGTYGYMAPEYAMDGLFSEKSDIFSFGVIVLEIISGKKNIAFFETDHSLNLPGKAWNLWKEGRCKELMDSTLHAAGSKSDGDYQVVRCVQLGLLCVQERAVDRPTMADVVSMLSSETIALPQPKEPAFFGQFISAAADAESSSSRQRHFTKNDITISEIYAR